MSFLGGIERCRAYSIGMGEGRESIDASSEKTERKKPLFLLSLWELES